MDGEREEMTQEEIDALFQEALLVVEGSNPERAIPMFEQLLVEGADGADVDHEIMIDLRMYLGRACMLAGLVERAVPVLRAALEDAERVTGRDSRLTYSCMGNLCRALGGLGEHEEAVELALDLFNRRLDQFGELDNGTLNALGHLAQLAYESGDVEGACELMEEQLVLRTEAFGPDDPRTETSRFNLTVMRARHDGDHAPVERLLREYERDFGSVSPQAIALRTSLAGIYERQGRREMALAEWAQVERDRTEMLGGDNVHTLVATVRKLRILVDMGEPRAAIELVETGRRIARIAGPDHPILPYCDVDRDPD